MSRQEVGDSRRLVAEWPLPKQHHQHTLAAATALPVKSVVATALRDATELLGEVRERSAAGLGQLIIAWQRHESRERRPRNGRRLPRRIGVPAHLRE